MVERKPEELRVVGSNPSLATMVCGVAGYTAALSARRDGFDSRTDRKRAERMFVILPETRRGDAALGLQHLLFLYMPVWRNWQTRHLEGVVSERACGFESRGGHIICCLSVSGLAREIVDLKGWVRIPWTVQ